MSYDTITSCRVSEVDFGSSSFNYIVKSKQSEKICFGSTIKRSTDPIGKYLSPFQKRTTREMFKTGPGSYSMEIYTSSLYPILEKVRSNKGIGPLASSDKRFKDSGVVKSPSPNRYNLSQKREVKPSTAPFGIKAKIVRISTNDIPGPATYDIRKLRKSRRIRFSSNFGRPKLMYTVETVCVPVPTDKCRKCNTVCQGDYWHLNYTQFLCSSCWNAEKYLEELLSKDGLKKMKKIRNCAFMHNHEGTNAAEIILSPEAIRKKIYLENYLDLYMKC